MLFDIVLQGGSIVEAAQNYDTIEIINKFIVVGGFTLQY